MEPAREDLKSYDYYRGYEQRTDQSVSGPVPLRTVMKEVLMHLYCRGLMPKGATRRVYSLLRLKED